MLSLGNASDALPAAVNRRSLAIGRQRKAAGVTFPTGLQTVALSDVGMRRTTNQDSLALTVADSAGADAGLTAAIGAVGRVCGGAGVGTDAEIVGARGGSAVRGAEAGVGAGVTTGDPAVPSPRI